ncbi:MAG: hypothetical protein H6668_20855 [Ardenticatenaceae bacterium]|nr:hypothetical protein [Ardenticatenaceae bacterium]
MAPAWITVLPRSSAASPAKSVVGRAFPDEISAQRSAHAAASYREDWDVGAGKRPLKATISAVFYQHAPDFVFVVGGTGGSHNEHLRSHQLEQVAMGAKF